MPDLRGKVALITGASSGIGESTALHFASLGCWLSLTARNKANLERVAEACSQQGIPRDKVLVVPGDVSVEKDVANVVEKTVKHFGKLDILVNNAGFPVQKYIQDASLEDFNQVWSTNFLGPLTMIRNAVPHLRQTKGNIINVSSVVSLIVVDSLALYATTKAALDNLTRYAALENAPYGVRVNAINPAVIKTSMLKDPAMSMDEHIKLLQTTAQGHALGRIGEPEEVARCIAFLASDDASFVTGITMPVDGGMLLLSSLHPPPPEPETPKTA
ncbi:glucose 1-dehydrogenase-like [Dermacentor albipictus]|uniref:glucose 1-dehydrogenase-like n=1 Tax=Dermacentor albipictus TaxID=60249 RepID=UPI0031FD6493